MSTSTNPELDALERHHLMVMIESLWREGRTEREIEAFVRARTGTPARRRTWPKSSLRLLSWGKGGTSLEPRIDRA